MASMILFCVRTILFCVRTIIFCVRTILFVSANHFFRYRLIFWRRFFKQALQILNNWRRIFFIDFIYFYVGLFALNKNLIPEYTFFIPGIKVCTAFFNRTLIPGIYRSGRGCETDFKNASKDHDTNSQNTKKCRFFQF